ncbi:IS30 family transposase [Bradyrhizobium sp. USDA 4523]
MGRTYKQLSLDDRCEIACLSANGSSVRQIAAALDRSPSTISRELRRNRGSQVGYKPSYAQHQMRARRWTGGRLEREPGLRRARCCNAFAAAGRPSRSLAGWPASTGAR